jgi:predicted unusual protein kinase regulating ubiquinone biosynthesis (AarF/ABC1/UbiB family)
MYRCQTYQEILDRTTRRELEQVWAVVTAPVTLNAALLQIRLADLARSNALLWVEAGLQIQEQSTRGIAAGRAVSRSLVLATVAADIFVGYSALRERARWLPALVQVPDWQWQHERGAQRVLETAATLGGALIKACQFASTRPDLLPARYIRALTPLQDRMPPRPWPEIERAIRSELGRPLEAIFEDIEHLPIAAASISQVHRARLHDGRQVAVKVQYPDIRDLVTTDLAVLERLVKALSRIAPGVQLQPVLDYLQWTLPLELDFTHEAEAMTQLRMALQHRSDVLVPIVLPELSSAGLIVMEYMDGIKITDREALEQAGIAPQAVAELLNDVYAEQMLKRGILHADPHPGNLLVQPGSPAPRLVLLDHGLTVPLAPKLVESLRRMVQALVSGDFVALKQALVSAGVRLDERVDLTGLLGVVGVLLGNTQAEEPEEVEEVEGAERLPPSGGGFAAGVRLGKSLGSIPVDLLMVGRTLGLLDGISKQLDPNIDTLEIVAHYA